MAQRLKTADRGVQPTPRTDIGEVKPRQPLAPGDRVVYTAPRVDVGGVKTGTTGVVERIADSVDMARVRWDTVEVHPVTYKECWSLSLTGTGATHTVRAHPRSAPRRAPSKLKAVRK
jgi:hypothetical protein